MPPDAQEGSPTLAGRTHFNIDRRKTLLDKTDYCHKDLITPGLVDRPEDWPWSSYRYYELDDSSALKMD